MFVIRLVLFVVLLLPAGAFAQDKNQLFEEMMQLLEKGEPFADDMQGLNELANQFNRLSRTSARQGVTPVIPLDPLKMRSMISESGKTRVALAVCGNVQGLRLCDDAATFLQEMTAQCSGMYLGTIDYDRYPGVPFVLMKDKNFNPEKAADVDPGLQLFERSMATGVYQRVSITSRTRPDIIAVVLCPEESDSFGRALQMLPKH